MMMICFKLNWFISQRKLKSTTEVHFNNIKSLAMLLSMKKISLAFAKHVPKLICTCYFTIFIFLMRDWEKEYLVTGLKCK